MSAEAKPFTIKALSKKQLRTMYDVSEETFTSWLKPVEGLGPYRGKCYTPAQVKKIIDHLGPP